MSRKKKPLVLLVDMDGVIVNLLAQWLPAYNEETGEDLKEEDIVEFELFKQCKFPDKLQEILLRQHTFFDAPPYKDSIKGLAQVLKDPRFQVYILTQVPRFSIYGLFEKRMWMKKFFPDFNLENVIAAHKKHMVDGDVFFDDNPKHLKEYKKAGKKRVTVCMKHNYNSGAEADYVVETWEEFRTFLDMLCQKRGIK